MKEGAFYQSYPCLFFLSRHWFRAFGSSTKPCLPVSTTLGITLHITCWNLFNYTEWERFVFTGNLTI